MAAVRLLRTCPRYGAAIAFTECAGLSNLEGSGAALCSAAPEELRPLPPDR